MGFPIQTTRECVAPFSGIECPGICNEIFESLGDLRADRGKQHLKVSWMLNLVKPLTPGFDGMGGFYIFLADSYALDDGVSIIRTSDTPLGSPGRYHKWL